MPLASFHPAVASWFLADLGPATEAQALAWPAIRGGSHTLVAAPTGSGKTLAAFLAALDELTREALALPDGLPDETRVVYVSPLKALSNDVHRNLELPLAGIERELAATGASLGENSIRAAVRTGDTPPSERTRMGKKPPHLLVTTPESLYILLGSRSGRGMLGTARTVIVDEIHAVAGNKRGSHLALSLERLDALAVERGGRPLTRVGLSATVKPLDEVARFLTGSGGNGTPPDCTVVDTGHRRALDLAVEVPDSPLEAVMSNEVWEEVYDRLAELIAEHRTTLVFVNTRRLAERVTRHLAERLGPNDVGEERVAAHHGSLSKAQRLDSEERLKRGELAAMVATASLELGIDIGSVELVCQLGSTRSIGALLQRIGRAGHFLGGVSKGRVFPLSRDELVEAAALVDAVARGELDRLEIPPRPLDVLAQQIVAEVAGKETARDGEETAGIAEDDLFALARRAWPYRELTRQSFDAVVDTLATGFSTRRGRRAAYLHHDQVNRRLRPRRGARLTALTSGGAIPDVADYQVVLEPAGTTLGSVNEDFAVESMPGDVFQLGNASWRILRIERGQVRVEDARGESPNIPFWFGEAPGRTDELSAAVARLRGELVRLFADGGREAAVDHLTGLGLPPEAAVQLADYLAAANAALGSLPDGRRVVAERFFDEAGDMHLVIHSPFGSRINRAWGLALRKRFCRTFNFELQAAASEDAIVLSLGPTHSFPLDTVFSFLSSKTVREILVQALLDSPMFGVRWRWNASRALALPRMRGGRRVPPQLQRHEAEDLLAVVFPDQLACLENIAGDREVPDHPLVEETLTDCLTEAMDVAGLERLLAAIESGEIETVGRDLTEPSPLAHEILNARPYAFLDDAPLEERRTQAVVMRRWLDPETAADLGALDQSAIDRVVAEARPDATDPDELHDALVTSGWLPAADADDRWHPYLATLTAAGRATVLRAADGAPELWIAAERLTEWQAAAPEAVVEPEIEPPARLADRNWEADEAVRELVRSRLDVAGPVTAASLAAECGLTAAAVDRAFAALEAEGYVLRGSFTPGGEPGNTPEEWCERRLLARIHRSTLDRLRREIEPVGRADLARYLLVWQRLAPAERAEGPAAVAAVLEQLAGFPAPAAAWEGEILPGRVTDYDPAWLDALCLSGRWVWCRATPPASAGVRGAPVRTTPIAFLPRNGLADWRPLVGTPALADAELSSNARVAAESLAEHGATFFADLADAAGLLHTQLEDALAELVAAGLVTADSFTGLRALLVPQDRRPKPGRSSRKAAAPFGMEGAGRWSLLADVMRGQGEEAPVGWTTPPEAVEAIARQLLDRYGVVFRALMARESLLPPWRELLWTLRRLEARGEIRGGRFVDGFSGEQYALPEAVARLRALRRQAAKRQREAAEPELVSVSGADPLNLAGVITQGDKLPALTGNRLLYRDGVPLALREAKENRFLHGEAGLEPAERWQAEQALIRTPLPPALRPYLGLTA